MELFFLSLVLPILPENDTMVLKNAPRKLKNPFDSTVCVFSTQEVISLA